MEEWRPIQDYHNVLVSNLGRVKKGDRLLNTRKNNDGYLLVNYTNNNQRRTLSVSRLIGVAFIPNPDNKPEIDHINGDRSDNRIENLRWTTRSENLRNTKVRKDNSVGLKGVCVDNSNPINKYRASIMYNGNRIHIGRFPKPEQAHEAYLAKARELHGEYFKE